MFVGVYVCLCLCVCLYVNCDVSPNKEIQRLVGLVFRKSIPHIILLPAGTSIVVPVGYMNQPTGLLHIYL